MPYRWETIEEGAPARTGAPFAVARRVERLSAWPWRSLGPRGFAVFISVTAILFLVPLLAFLGTMMLWGLLPFLLLTLAGIWHAIARNWRSGEILEELTITPERITLRRREPDGRILQWEANPYWVEVRLHERGGPVPAYLTLRGGGREVELGAFLDEQERRTLAEELRRRLEALRR